ncbi:hypothetical protein EVAR_18542_1 [Eumeta japonica]|uniref:Uncharacterized protein n=1 Tax=Eumeta variegata TaxID=151549 RepID=A0A4C1V4X9_EUMVA|nr:hypothetical protein EVAR_18542_1 [Eumeta japonica]
MLSVNIAYRLEESQVPCQTSVRIGWWPGSVSKTKILKLWLRRKLAVTHVKAGNIEVSSSLWKKSVYHTLSKAFLISRNIAIVSFAVLFEFLMTQDPYMIQCRRVVTAEAELFLSWSQE